MDQERERIQADLRGLLEGEVRCDDVFLQMYATDASIYEIPPLGVIRPRGLSDVVTCVQYAAENNLSIHARGAGTGLAGESLGPGLILDFSHSMRRILQTDEETVRIQPGVVLAQLNKHLAPMGRLFGPDPALRSVTTMGSVLAIDGAGSHWLQYGSARDHIVSMQVVLADGEVIDAEPTAIEAKLTETAIAQTGGLGGLNPALGGALAPEEVAKNMASPRRRQELVSRLAELIRREEKTISEHRPKTLVQRSGYQLNDVIDGNRLDLAKLLVGSEGTLGLITEATVKTVARPKHRGLTMLFFDRIEAAAKGALEVREMGASTCDLMDRRLLTIARDTDVNFELLIPREAEALLLIEIHGDDPAEIRGRLEKITARLHRRKRLAFDSRTTLDKDQRDLYWRLARRVVPSLYRLKGATRPLPFIEDIAVPPSALPSFLVKLQNILKSHHVIASFFAHAGHGQIHVRPFMDLSSQEDVRKIQDLAASVYEETLAVGGTISGEHGDGLSRTWFARRQHGPLYDIYREVKRIFDPQNIFNPGKVVADVPQPLTKNLRPVVVNAVRENSDELEETDPPESPTGTEAGKRSEPIQLQLNWLDTDIAYSARTCNGCGRCRTLGDDTRMCPIFRFAPREEASPRAKANLMRAVLTGRLDPSELASESMREIVNLCVNCHQCRLECPATVDIPKMMVEAKAQYVAVNGLKPSEWCLTRLDLLSAVGSKFHYFSNWAISNRMMRWLLEKVLKIAQGRKLPRFAPRSFIKQAARRGLTRSSRTSGRKVLYFLDIYANWHDVQLAEAFVAILEHNGISVYVPTRQQQSGMAKITYGAIDQARQIASENVALLADAVRQGYQIVATEPSAALCLQHEYLYLLDDDDARLVAENTSEACTYLWRMHQEGKLKLDLKPINASLGYHQPCHVKALQVGSPGENLLRLIPGLTVHSIEKGCSGMAGSFGLRKENYRSSLRAGWGLISALRDQSIQVGTTECSSCKIQMEQGAAKPTIHPLKFLALAYGLTPQAASLLTARSQELTVT